MLPLLINGHGLLPVFDIHEVHTESIQIESNFERAQFKEDICYSISEVSSKSTVNKLLKAQHTFV